MDIRYGRKRKGIKIEMNKKIDEWLESIEDEEVRKFAKKEVIVTGGSIASMLLGEKINDFDIYFRTMATTKLVAEYYADQFLKRNNYLPNVEVEFLVNAKGKEEERVTIRVPSNGVVKEKEDETDTKEIAKEPDKKYRPVFMSQNAITLSDKVQIIIRFYGEPDEIHDNYDFVHATCYWDHYDQNLVLPGEALESLLSRNLIYCGSLYPIASIFRMKKFIERGWRITAGQQLKIMWQISELNLSDFAVLREQLTGVDLTYLWELVQALEDVGQEKLNSSYVGAIIDKIFD